MANIGVIGTGLMGQPMAMQLLKITDRLTVYNRSAEKTATLQTAGAQIAANPTAVFTASDVVVLMLSDAQAIAQCLFQPTVPLAAKTVIQMGTIAPQESLALAQQITTQGGAYLEAPVLGSIPEARSGQLIVMVGATPTQFEQWQFLFNQLGQNPTHVGPVGTAAAVKLALNQLIGSLTTAFGLSLALTQQAGVNPDIFMDILRQSALYASTFDKKLSRMCEQNYANPNFPVRHLLKDMQLFNQSASEYQLPTDTIAAIENLLQATIAAGLANADYSALFSQISSTKTS